MSVPKSPKSFPYVLYTTRDEAGTHYWVKDKRTQVEMEINLELMRVMRAMERDYKDEENGLVINGQPVISLGTGSNEGYRQAGAAHPDSMEDAIIQKTDDEAFQKLLTPLQREIYTKILKEHQSIHEYVQSCGGTRDRRSVRASIRLIAKKYKKFFL